jgi:hypothetical protein
MDDRVSSEARKEVNDKIAQTKASDMNRTMDAASSSKEKREQNKREREQREKEQRERDAVHSPLDLFTTLRTEILTAIFKNRAAAAVTAAAPARRQERCLVIYISLISLAGSSFDFDLGTFTRLGPFLAGRTSPAYS